MPTQKISSSSFISGTYQGRLGSATEAPAPVDCMDCKAGKRIVNGKKGLAGRQSCQKVDNTRFQGVIQKWAVRLALTVLNSSGNKADKKMTPAGAGEARAVSSRNFFV